MAILSVFVVVVAAAAAFMYQSNPLLFGRSTGASPSEYTIYKHQAFLDDELLSMSGPIGNDFQGYRNHCLRVLTFTKYFLDKEAPDIEKELPNAIDLASVALAYHDIGLWTDHDLNYLEPSSAQMEKVMGESFTPHEIRLMSEIILQHHKVTPYSSSEFSEAENVLINAVRKGDWADATMGLIRWGLPAGLLDIAYDQIPEGGFHMMLAGMDARLSPGNKINGTLEVLKIFKW